MNIPTKKVTHEGCCSETNCDSALRNNYFEHKRLTAESFRIEQKYFLNRRHLMNRAINGWGVVYGYGVAIGDAGSNQLAIGAGLALDKCGRELVQSGSSLGIKDLIILDEKGRAIEPDKAIAEISSFKNDGSGDDSRICWLLSVHYAERLEGFVKIKDACECECYEWDHTCETVVYTLHRISCGECCVETNCELKCECASGPCCDDQDPANDSRRHDRGGCRCLCEHVTKFLPNADCTSLCEVEGRCERLQADLTNGVPLACIEIAFENNCPTFGSVDPCGPRRLVKSNDLLFDLIRGCDLTTISDFGWKKWHRHGERIPFEDFAEAFGPDGGDDNGQVTQEFWVEFSRPVQSDSLRRDCFVMTVIKSELDDRWWESRRVPIVRVEKGPGALVQRATIAVDHKWYLDTIKGASSIFRGNTRIEIEVRGDFIVDCNGQTLDANAHGRSTVPSGNGTPGGTFLSTFRVGRVRSRSMPPKEYNDDRNRGVS